MILGSESYAQPVFHVLSKDHSAALLEQYPYPTPVFHITRFPEGPSVSWRVRVDCEMNFTENMKQRADVLEYILQAQAFVDNTDITSIRSTVTRLLVHWTKLFPRGVPDSIL